MGYSSRALSTPHGVPGVLKNALDWVVGSGELIDKPIALVNASPRSTFAHAQLAETLTTMSGAIVPDASITVTFAGRPSDGADVIADRAAADALRAAVAALVEAARDSSALSNPSAIASPRP